LGSNQRLLPCEGSAAPTRTSATPRVAPHPSRSTTQPNQGRVVLRVAMRGMVSGNLLARRWPRTNLTQVGRAERPRPSRLTDRDSRPSHSQPGTQHAATDSWPAFLSHGSRVQPEGSSAGAVHVLETPTHDPCGADAEELLGEVRESWVDLAATGLEHVGQASDLDSAGAPGVADDIVDEEGDLRMCWASRHFLLAPNLTPPMSIVSSSALKLNVRGTTWGWP
jgi:hypothetical protein